MPVDTKMRDRAIALIQQQYGEQAVRQGDETDRPSRISTGSPELDFAMCGGVPIGRWTRFFGGYSSAKTLKTWHVVANAQKMGMDCVYYNIEKSYDSSWVESLGVDTKKLVVIEGSTIEEVGTALEALLGTAHLHVLDSCSQAVSIDELNSKVEDWHRGLNARVWGKVLRRANERFDDRENTVVFIDQIRINQSTNSEEPPGGKFMEHISGMTVHFKRGKWLFYDKDNVLQETSPKVPSTLSGGIEADGIEYQMKVVKSKIGKAFRQARIRQDLNTGKFDELHELVKGATYFKLVESSGSWFSVPDLEKPIQGKKKLREYIEENPDFAQRIRDEMRARA